MALENNTPVVLLTDAYLGNGSALWRLPKLAELPEIHPHIATEAHKEGYNAVCRDAETKVRFSQMNDNYSPDEMDILIENKEFVKKILQNKDLVTIQKIIEEFPNTDFHSILNILRKEQGDYNTNSFQQSISDERKREIGDKGECYACEGENIQRTKYIQAHLDNHQTRSGTSCNDIVSRTPVSSRTYRKKGK